MKTFSYSILATLLAISMFGCGSSSPRFANRDKSPPSPKAEKKNPVRFSSEAEEEKKEDDRKVEPHEVERIKAGDRDFKKEKNVAIKPLDHSKMMHEISRYMGVPYQLGASDVNGMDCSGYTMVVYKNSIGKTLPRTAGDQSRLGKPVEPAELKFGDLVFFNTTGDHASHVGIYLGDDLFAHASVSLGVTISSLESSYYKKRFETARRIVE